MSRRFQFSLTRSLIAVGLLCMAFAFQRQAGIPVWLIPWRLEPVDVAVNGTLFQPMYAARCQAAVGVCLAIAAGVMTKQTIPFLGGAILTAVPFLWFIRMLY